jgi:hypothetical protein
LAITTAGHLKPQHTKPGQMGIEAWRLLGVVKWASVFEMMF